jgi:hypothetical protein
MNDQTKIKQTDVAHVDGRNPFVSHGADTIEREMLKFVKDGFVAGKEKRKVAIGTRLIANMHSYEIGHINWPPGGGKPLRCMGRVVDGFAPDRNQLPDNDSDLWAIDGQGRPEDPFKDTSEITLANPETREVFLFSTSSLGGRKALRKLSYAYGNEMAKHPNEWPIIALEVGGYEHKTRGWVGEPSLPIVGWINQFADNRDGLSAPASKWAPALAGQDTREPPPYEDGDPGFSGHDDADPHF